MNGTGESTATFDPSIATLIGPDGDGNTPRAQARSPRLGSTLATVKPGSAGVTPSTRCIKSRVGVDDQPWLMVPPNQHSVHDVAQRSRATTQSRTWSTVRPPPPPPPRRPARP